MGTRIENPPSKNDLRWLTPVQAALGINTNMTPTAGRCYLQLVQVDEPTTVDAVLFTSGSGPAGTMYVGIYSSGGTDTPVGGTLLGISADTTVTANFGTQVVALTASVDLQPGSYYICMEFSSTTPTPYRNSNVSFGNNLNTYFDQSYGALPATVPAIASGVCPIMLLRCII